MKPLLLFACIILSFGAFSQSNVYKPFPLANGTFWNVNWYNLNCLVGNPPMIQGDPTYQYKLIGDTTIQAISYKIINRSNFIPSTVLCAPSLPLIDTNTVTAGGHALTFGGLRQDTIEKKVYFYSFISNMEYLLYDFGMQVGDTIKGYFATEYIGTPNNCQYCTVNAIDSIYIANTNTYYKRIYINQYNSALIEGIGTDQGLFEPLYHFEEGGTLICQSTIGQELYSNGSNGCFLDFSAMPEQIVKPNISIFPNPAATEFTVKVDNAQKLTIQLYNLTGQKQCSYHVIGNQIAIPRENWPNGVYIVHILMDNDVLIVKKLVFAD